jgi:hypothetical protein
MDLVAPWVDGVVAAVEAKRLKGLKRAEACVVAIRSANQGDRREIEQRQ